jgi:dephospho-CoA kinase
MNKPPKPVIALAGGVASGKSEVARAFARLGAAVIDADAQGHAVLRERAVKAALTAEFGEGILGKRGDIERAKLAAVAFADPRRVQKLNAITHPAIRRRVNEELERALQDPAVPAVVLDVSLLLESGAYEGKYSLLLYVESNEADREQRASKRGWPQGERQRRQARQSSLEDKRKRADLVLINSGTLTDLERRVQEIWRQLTQERPAGAKNP